MTLIIIVFLIINNKSSIPSHLKSIYHIAFLLFYILSIFIVAREYILFYKIKNDIVRGINISDIRNISVVKFDKDLNNNKFFEKKILRKFSKDNNIKKIVNIFRKVKMEKRPRGRHVGNAAKSYYLLITFKTRKGKVLSYLIEKPNWTYFIYYKPITLLYKNGLIKVDEGGYSPYITSSGLLMLFKELGF